MSEDLLSHTEWVRRLARSLAGDDATADDLVQETWIAASRRPPDLDRPVRPWLTVVVRNLFLKRLARERRREAHHHGMAADADGAPPASSPEAAVESAQMQRLLAELVAALDEPYRQTLVLHYFEDQSAADIARTLGIPPGTVRWRLKIARDELRERLDRRHAGQREVWRRALLPLFPASAPRAPRAQLDRAPLAFGVVGLVIAIGLTRACLREPALMTDRAQRESDVPSAASVLPSAPGPGVTLDREKCLAAVTRLRAEVAIAEREHLLKLDGEERFALGNANPVAQQVIAPVIARILAGDRPAPTHTLECKTWGCRLLLLYTAQELAADDYLGWQRRLQDDLDISERLDSFTISTPAPTKDPVSQVPLYEQPVFLALADPSGRRLPRREPAPAMAGATTPLPSTVAGCQQELALLRGRLELARSALRAPAGPTPTGDWIGLLERRTKELEAQGLSEACVARFPGRGRLEVRFELPRTRPNEGTRPRLMARYGGSLAGTPLGQCLADALVEPILSTALPDAPLVHGVAYYPIVID